MRRPGRDDAGNRAPGCVSVGNGSRAGRPPSPCVKVCTLGDGGVCEGCLRTLDEIARWPAMDAEDQWRLVEELARRRARGAA